MPANGPETSQDRVAKFVSAVKDALEPAETLQARAGAFVREASGDVDAACRAITKRQSNVSAASAGMALLPGLVPGVGTAAAAYSSMFGQMVQVMKIETELCLMQASVYGFDVQLPREQRLALLLASFCAFEVQVGSDAALRAGVGSVESIENYTPSEADDVLTRTVKQLLMVNTAKRGAAALLLAVPIVGVGVGASMNKVLTRRVGARAQAALKHRRGSAR